MTDRPTGGETESAFAKLRRRKVVQWGVAYAAGAWLLLQVLALVVESYDWPHTMMRAAIGLAIAGFLVVLTIAWFHGDKGEQRVTRSEFLVLTLVVALGGTLVWQGLHGPETSSVPAVPSPPAPPAVAAPTPVDERPSIAVLPFENRSDEHKDAYFVDGIHDDVLTQLSKIGALKVVSRTSVERFRKTELSTRDIAAQLGVKTILEGGVQRAGDRIRINVQLIDAATDSHLWAETYDRELTAANIFGIQSEVATAIAAALKATLTPAERSRTKAIPTQNLEAWESYQRGKQRLAQRTAQGFIEAEAYFRRAIKADANFALAYAGLAKTLEVSVAYMNRTDHPYKQARAAIDQALKLDPELSEAWVALGLLAYARDQYSEAEGLFRRAIDLDPNNADAHRRYGFVLLSNGRLAEGKRALEKAATLDPFEAITQVNLGDVLSAEGKLDEASTHFRRAIELDPSFPVGYGGYARALATHGRLADAAPLIEKYRELAPNDPYGAKDVAEFYLDLGDERRFAALIADAGKRWPDNFKVQVGLAYQALLQGDEAAAGRYARAAFEGNPNDGEALGLLRNLDLKHGRYDEALARYRKSYPDFFEAGPANLKFENLWLALDVAPVLLRRGDTEQARALLAAAGQVNKSSSGTDPFAHELNDAFIHAMLGEKAQALSVLSAAQKSGWNAGWSYFRDFEPAFDSIRDDPAFRAIFADIERDMARQRAELAARPKDAPLLPEVAGK